MQPPPDSNYPRQEGFGGKYQPFQGDKIYVIIELIVFLVGLGATFYLMPQLTDEALKNAAAQSNGQKINPDFVKTMMMGVMGCMFAVCLPISIFVWVNIWKGKKWAFIVSTVLLVLGLLGQIRNFSSPAMMGLAIFTTLTLVARLGYMIMRLAGKVGPAVS